MQKSIITKFTSFFIAAAVLVGVDQWSKYEAIIKLRGRGAYSLIKDVLYLWYSENKGAAFGILQGKHVFFYIITAIVLVGILFLLYKLPKGGHYMPLFICGFMIFAGALGNFIDRLTRNYVVDFIYFRPINFPIFNFADICVTVGTFILFLCLVFFYKEDELEFYKK